MNEQQLRLISSHERDPQSATRIYVASLSDYVDGRLHGMWLDAAVDNAELWHGVQTMLRTSRMPDAEEWAIHDYEGFGPLHLGEYENIETVAAVARNIAEHGQAFAHWAAWVGSAEALDSARFEDAYLGHWENVEAYADELIGDVDCTHAAPLYVQPYVKVDIAGFARDLELSGDIVTSEGDGGVYIFEGGR